MSKIHTTVRVGVDGSLTLPAFFMRGMGYEPGEEVPITTPANQYICDCDANRLLVTRTCDDAECTGYVDINNCPFAPQLLNRGFAKDTGLYKESGFCSYPLWTFEETVLKETGGEKYERYARAYDEYMESSFIGMMGAEDETGEEICTGMMM